jgi:hypothetical protein
MNRRYQEAAADGLAATGGRQRQRRSKARRIRSPQIGAGL